MQHDFIRVFYFWRKLKIALTDVRRRLTLVDPLQNGLSYTFDFKRLNDIYYHNKCFLTNLEKHFTSKL